MHIRNDWQFWGVDSDNKQRVKALCGKSTTKKYVGVPGITRDQPPGFYGPGDYAWCIQCCGIMILQIALVQNGVFESQSPDLIRLYRNALEVVTDQTNRYVTSLT